MRAFILTLLLCLSCTRNAEVTKDAMGTYINPISMKVSHLNEIRWLVGKNKEAKVSQSITFILEMPKISNSDLEYLNQHKGIDSWIIRVIADRGSKTQDLGSLYVLFKTKKLTRGTQNSGPISNITIKIFYAAAYASERFRGFKCPAFSHNKRISSMKINGKNEDFDLSIGQAVPYNEKNLTVELSPSSFNGGYSLIGDYFMEIAAYDSTKKYIYSSFKRIPMYVRVEEEDEIRISSCDGVHQERE